MTVKHHKVNTDNNNEDINNKMTIKTKEIIENEDKIGIIFSRSENYMFRMS